MNKEIKIKINGQALTFLVTAEAYKKYVNESTPLNKIAPARNLLVRCVVPADKDALQTLLEMPSVDLQVASHLMDQYLPDLEIEVGE